MREGELALRLAARYKLWVEGLVGFDGDLASRALLQHKVSFTATGGGYAE